MSSVGLLIARSSENFEDVKSAYSTLLVHQQSIVIASKGKGASVRTSSLNLVLSTIGVGALTLPWTTASVGWLQSGILLVTFFFVSIYNLYLLDEVCRSLDRAADAGSYANMVAAALGKPGAYALEMFMLLYSFGLSVSYMGVVGSEVAVFVELALGTQDGEALQRNLISAVAIFVVLPLSLLPDTLLRLSGAVGTFCMILTTIIVVCMVPWKLSWPFVAFCNDALAEHLHVGHLEPVRWVSSPKALLSAVPMFSFCMNGATAFVSIRSEMVAQKFANIQPHRKDVVALIWLAQTFALVDYIVSAAAGYVAFCGAAPDNVLDGFPTSHAPSLVARMALALQLAAACAGVYIPLARAALCHLWFGVSSDAPRGVSRIVSTAVLVASMVVVARALDGALALPLGLTSAVCTTAIMFVFPGMCASSVHKSMWGKVLPVAFAVAGLFIGTASTVIWREGRLKNGFERPVVIHRAILGSVERMSAILMEHYAGKWPFWLSPRQVQVVPVGTQFNEYAQWVERQLQIHGFYAEAETSGKTLNKKVREAQLAQWNYVAVVGAEEQNALSVNLRLSPSVVMIHVSLVSGQEIACFNADDLKSFAASGNSLRAFKQRLQSLVHTSPFCQELLCEGEVLNEADAIPDPAVTGHVHVQLVLLQTCSAYSEELVSATAQDDDATVGVLLRRRQDPDEADACGRTALYLAAQNGNVQITKLLLEAAADVNKSIKDTGETPPLLAAAQRGHLEATGLLIDAGADKEKPNVWGTSPLLAACEKGYLEMVRLLIDSGHVRHITLLNCGGRGTSGCANYWEAIPLQLAAERGHCDVVAKLVQAGSSIDQADQHGRSALFYACEGGHLDVAQLLVSAGADKDKTSNSGLSPLSAASEEGHLEVVRFLIQAGADKEKAKIRARHLYWLLMGKAG
ncbi:THS1 [Symbiodinium pilosum]|uniref:THS1 protein n=1 Tax=Symbiodinium pilosum TaxID=2952 RepID=A0A812XI89_SYMPI|nr:THS1 [Symbiodinium pilosum]